MRVGHRTMVVCVLVTCCVGRASVEEAGSGQAHTILFNIANPKTSEKNNKKYFYTCVYIRKIRDLYKWVKCLQFFVSKFLYCCY